MIKILNIFWNFFGGTETERTTFFQLFSTIVHALHTLGKQTLNYTNCFQNSFLSSKFKKGHWPLYLQFAHIICPRMLFNYLTLEFVLYLLRPLSAR